ncbi:hypothetical protein RB597_009459 [Gaeumannomyces tritici]
MKAFLQGRSSQRKGSDSAGRIETQDMKPPKHQESHMKTVPVSSSGSSKKALNKLFQRSSSSGAPATPSEDAGLTAPSGSFVAPSAQPQPQYWPAQGQEQQQQQLQLQQQQQQQQYAPATTAFYPRPVDQDQHLGSQSVVPLFADSASIQRGMELHGESAMIHPAPLPSQTTQYNAPQGQMPQLPPVTAAGPLELPVQHRATPMTAPYLGTPLTLDPRQSWKPSDRSPMTVAPPAPAELQVVPVSVTVSNVSGRPATSTEQMPHRERTLPVTSESTLKLVPNIAPLKTNKRRSVPPRASSDGKVMGMNSFKNTEGEPLSRATTSGSDGAVVGAPAASHFRNVGPGGNEAEMASRAETGVSQEPHVESRLPAQSATMRPPQELAATTESGGAPEGVTSRPSTAGGTTASESESALERKYHQPQIPVAGAGVDNNFPQPHIASSQQMQSPYYLPNGDALLGRAADAASAGAARTGPSDSHGNAPAGYKAFKPPTTSERPSRDVRIQQMIIQHRPDLVTGGDGAVDWVETLVAFVPALLEKARGQSTQGPGAEAYNAVGNRSASSGRGGVQGGRAERQLQDELAALQKTVASLEQEKGRLQDDLRFFKAKATKRGEAIRERDDVIRDREDEIAELKKFMGSKVSDLKRDCDDAAARLSRADADRAALQSSLAHARHETESQKAQYAGLAESLGREVNKYKGMSEQWAQALNDERADFQTRLTTLERTQQETLAKQKASYDTAVQQLNHKFVEELKRVQMDHAASVERLNSIIANIGSKHQAEVEESRNKHASEMQDLKAQSTKAVADLKSKFEKETRGLRNRMAAYSTGTYTAIPDSDLVVSLRRLAQDISNLSLYVPQPAGYVPSPEADPGNHVARSLARGTGAATWPRFVQSVCWTVVLRGFFSLPLGFGALGCQGLGYEIMAPLFEMFIGKDMRAHEDLPDVFPEDKETNVARAWLMAGILRDVAKRDASHPENGPVLASIFEDNARLVSRELTAQLQHVSNGGLDPGAEAQVGGVVRAVGVFALEMGSQRAQVALEKCDYGEVVALGERFGDAKGGGGGGDGCGDWERVQVDLLTQPCLIRKGDGREDVSTLKVIVKGDIISL